MKKKSKKKTHVLKIKKLPAELAAVPASELPLPLADLVEAVKADEIVEIHFAEPEPTRWERLVKWFSGE